VTYYRVCPKCGSNLDPCEKCDCQKNVEQREESFEKHIKLTKTGQYILNLEHVGKEAII